MEPRCNPLSAARAARRRATRAAAKLAERRDRVHKPKGHEHGVRVLYSTSDGSDAGAWAPSTLPENARASFDAEVARLETDDGDPWMRSRGPVHFELIEFGVVTKAVSFPPAPAPH